MARGVVEIGDAEFEREVLESKEPVLVEFSAGWCAPCRAILPALEGLAADYRGRMKVAKLDVEVAVATTERYGVRAMPTLLFFREGQVARQLVGVASRRALELVADEVLSRTSPAVRPVAAQAR